MPSPTTPLSGENETMVGATGATVSTVTLSAVEAAPVLPAASVAVAVRLWAPLLSAAVVELQAPVPLAVALPSNVAPHPHLTVAHHASIRGERGDARRHWRHGIDGDSQRGRSHAGVAGRIGGGGGQAVGAVAQTRSGVAPGPAAGRGGAAQ